MEIQVDWEAFRRDRNEMLLSDDPAVWAAYISKYKIDLPNDPHVLEMAVNKARTGCTDLPEEVRAKAQRWLTQRGLGSWS